MQNRSSRLGVQKCCNINLDCRQEYAEPRISESDLHGCFRLAAARTESFPLEAASVVTLSPETLLFWQKPCKALQGSLQGGKLPV